MNLSFLPAEIVDALNKLNMDKLYEIRLRVGFPIKVCYDGKYVNLSYSGISSFDKKIIKCTTSMINNVVQTVTEHSIYAFNEQICRGYIDANDGVRIGVSGEGVLDGNKLVTIKNFTSLNVRIPHLIIGCAEKVTNQIIENKRIFNTLLISPPFYGKTTVLKDMARIFNNMNLGCILIIDERGEFSMVKGENIDSIKYLDKLTAFNLGLRAMSPNIIITDEIFGESDWRCIAAAANSGVKIIASCHADNVLDIKNKLGFINVFERYVVLKDYMFNSDIADIYNGDFVKI